MKKIALLLIFSSFLTGSLLANEEPFLFFSEPWDDNNQVHREIRRIHIDALDAFDPKIPEYRSWVFRFLNKLHNRTDDSFIRRVILFKEGEVFDEDLLTESERNLRKYKFLGDVWIESKVVASNKVDLHVHTEDQWTLQFNISAGKSSGFSTLKFSVDESNFLGLGKSLGIAYDRNPERTTYNLLYYDPQFLNSRWNFQTDFQKASDGWRYTSDIVRPFYSLDTRWAYGATWDAWTYAYRFHYKGRRVAEIDTDQRTGHFFAARSWGERYDKKRFGFVVSVDNVFYPHPARIIFPEATTVKAIKKDLQPKDRERFEYGAIFKWDRQRFIEETYLDNFGRVEDLPEGLQVAAILIRSENAKPNPDYYQLQTLAQYTHQVTDSQYFALSGEFTARQETSGNFNNILFDGYAHYYFQMPQFHVGPIRFPRQTLAANLSATLTHEVDAPFQISLGENEGLRGYTFKSFTGQNKVLFNVEDRIFTPLDFRLVGIGLAAFLDAGYVWSSDDLFQLNDYGVSAGIGLRIGLKKSQSSRVIRVDLAVPLRKASRSLIENQKGYSISVSSGHIFSAIEYLPKLFQLF